MITKPPAFQMYAQDFLTGTAYMTPEEVGAYIRLLCFSWANGPLPDDAKVLRQISGLSTKKLKKILEKFSKNDNGQLINERLETERTKQKNFRKKQSEKAKKRYKNEETEQATAEPRQSHGNNNGSDLAHAENVPSLCPSSSSSIYFVKIKGEIFKMKPSDFLTKKDQMHYEAKMMTTFSGLDKKKLLARFDEEYNAQDFNDLSHFRNSFKSVGMKVREEARKPVRSDKKVVKMDSTTHHVNPQEEYDLSDVKPVKHA